MHYVSFLTDHFSKKMMFRTSHQLYARARYYWAYTHQLDFLNTFLKSIGQRTYLGTLERPETSALDGANPNLRGLFFFWVLFWKFFWKKSWKWITQNRPSSSELSLPRAFVRHLGFVIALSVCWKINFSCASTGGAIQLYLALMSYISRISWHVAYLVSSISHTMSHVLCFTC